MIAEHAYRQTLRNIKSKESLEKIDAQEEFHKVLLMINDAVRKCEMCLYVNFELKPGTISLLRENGYEVCDIGNNRISWRNKKTFWEKFWEYVFD